MSASRAEPRYAARALAAIGLAVLAGLGGPLRAPLVGTAWAQGAAPAPVPLIPQEILPPLAAVPGALSGAETRAGSRAGSRDLPSAARGDVPSATRGDVPEQAGLGALGAKRRVREIEINPLARIAPEAIGTLGAEDGGFGIEMWRGTSRQVIEGLLRQLPSRMPSRAMRDLTRRLLLSVAPPPAAEPAAFASANSDARGLGARDAGMPAQLLVLRAERLAALGEIPALVSLLSVVPAHVEQESLERLHVEALFLSHDQGEACRRVRNGIAIYHRQAFWQKAMVFCNMAAGEADRGTLGLDLLREQGISDDPLFFALALRFIGVKAALPDADTLSPLHVAMLGAAGAPLPPTPLEQVPPGLLYAIATASDVSPAVRVAAAERACARGIVDGEALARGYDAMSFAPDQLGNAIAAAAGLEDAAARALLFQATRRETLPATRAEVLRVALEQAARADLFAAAAEVYWPLIAEIDPVPQMAWFAADAGRALYGAGRHRRAGAWLALGRQEAIVNPQASAAVAALWPYSRLAGGDSLITDGSLAAWRAMRGAAGVAPPAGATALLRAAFQALGELDPLTWSDIAADQATDQGEPSGHLLPGAAFLYALGDASEARRVGETVALSLIVLGAAGPAESHELALGAVLLGLSRVGLEREARALAIEAALANGI